jgi:hypothetical protein
MSKQQVAAMLMALAIGGCAHLDPAPDARGDDVSRAELMALQEAWIAAEVAGDGAALEGMMDERFLHTFASGATVGRSGYIDWITGLDIEPFTLVTESIELHGDTAVVIDRNGNSKITWIAVRRGDRWVAISQTFSRISAQQGESPSGAVNKRA